MRRKNGRKETADKIEAISKELAKIARKLDKEANLENEESWISFYASCDVKAAASRLFFAARQMRHEEPKAKEKK